MEPFMKCRFSMNLAFPAYRLGQKTWKMGPEIGSRGVNIVILKIPEGPDPNGAHFLKIHIFSEFF